jgi:hypothetical protein
VIDYAVRIKDIGGIIWLLAVFRREKDRGSLNHPFAAGIFTEVNFSLVRHELQVIHMEIEAFTKQPARLIRLVVEGSDAWMSPAGRMAIRRVHTEIENCGFLWAFPRRT